MTKNSTQNLFSCAEVRKDIAVNYLGCDALLCHQEYAVCSKKCLELLKMPCKTNNFSANLT